MSLSEAFADDRAVSTGHLPYPAAYASRAGADLVDAFDDVDATPDTVSTPPIAAPDFGHLYGRCAAMRALYRQIGKVAGTLATVLILGESGTGKELIARTVHDLSPRADRAFVAVNCGAISPNLIESELFGHEKGSFTGASGRHTGYFEHACGGTIFLDEITEMPLEMQVKLLRVLESGAFMRVGGTEPIQTRVRIVAATNRSLQDAVADGALREDLMYRLATCASCATPCNAATSSVRRRSSWPRRLPWCARRRACLSGKAC
jgi:DNA-binding NtrC family response regulator